MIIGISGGIGAGKDTVGNIIQYLTDQCVWKSSQKLISYNEWIQNKEDNENLYSSIFKIKKFADKLKDIVCILINCTRKDLENHTFKETILDENWWYFKDKNNIYYPYKTYEGDIKDVDLICLTPRMILQSFGTDFGRNFLHPYIWINSLFEEYNNLENWVITDLRFQNEYNKIMEDKNNFTIKIIKTENFENIFNHHSSEKDLNDFQFNFIISNNSTIEDLISSVKKILIKRKILN